MAFLLENAGKTINLFTCFCKEIIKHRLKKVEKKWFFQEREEILKKKIEKTLHFRGVIFEFSRGESVHNPQ